MGPVGTTERISTWASLTMTRSMSNATSCLRWANVNLSRVGWIRWQNPSIPWANTATLHVLLRLGIELPQLLR